MITAHRSNSKRQASYENLEEHKGTGCKKTKGKRKQGEESEADHTDQGLVCQTQALTLSDLQVKEKREINWFKPWKDYSEYNSLEEGKLEVGDEGMRKEL